MAAVKVICGDIFDSDADVLVNPVNCVGVMGAGLAKEFKRRFPGMFLEYERACINGKLVLGTPRWHIAGGSPVWVVSFPTKYDWREKSSMQSIVNGLLALGDQILELAEHRRSINKIALPLLGAGLGGLDPVDVMYYTAHILSGIPDVDMEIYVHPKDVTEDIAEAAERINGTYA